MISILIANLIYSYIVYLLMNTISKEKSSDRSVEIVSYILFFVVITCFSNYDSGIESFFVLGGMLFVITLNYNISLYFKICISVLIFLFTNILYITMLALFRPYIIDFPVGYYQSVLLFSRILMIFVYVLFVKFKEMIYSILESEKQSFIIVMTPMISLVIIYSMVTTIDVTRWIIADIIGISVINIFMFYMFEYIDSMNKRKNEDELIKQQNAYYLKQFELIRESNERMQSLKHDLKNHILYIQNKSSANSNLSEYKDGLLESVLNNNQYANSGNLTIDSVLNFKIKQAVEKNFDFKLRLIIPESLKIKENDMVTLFGNIIDNAIEHCLDTNRTIRMVIKYECGILYIDELNPSKKINMKNGNIITSKADKISHGIGLKNVRRVIEKYNGDILIDNENYDFRISIMIPC